MYIDHKDKKLYGELYKEIGDIKSDEATKELTKTDSSFIEKVKELKQENNEIKGWIKIEGTQINYPLLQSEDNNYYLSHNYKKEKNSCGSIYINSKSNIEDQNANVIIYGHCMKNGEMFANLHKYKQKEYYEEHPEIKIITEEKEETYEIICAFKSRIYYQDEKNVFRYYNQHNFENEEQYNKYIENCKKIQLYETGIEAKYGEQLITLITCEYSQENGRMVVVAKKIA